MKIKFTLFFLLFNASLYAQFQLPNHFFQELDTLICPYDSTETVVLPLHWNIYQTQNDEWNGSVDSSVCVSVYLADNDRMNIDLGSIDLSKPIFIQSKTDAEGAIIYEPNSLFNGSFSIETSDEVSLNTNLNCPNDLCSGLIIGLTIPNADNSGITQRYYQGSFVETSNNNKQVGFCFASEKFANPELSTFVLKLSLEDAMESSVVQLKFSFIESFSVFDIHTIEEEVIVPEWTFIDTSYNYHTSDFFNPWQGTNIIALYNESWYPGPDSVSLLPLNPEPNSTEQEWINFIIDDYYSMVFQPFTQLIGGFVEGSDSIRHHYNLVNNGADLCMFVIIEFQFTGDNGYIHNRGDIEFHGTAGCMMFRHGGHLEVGEGAYLQYGDGGEGILALGNRAKVHLKEGSTLAIDNLVQILDNVQSFDEQIKVDLQPGSLLTFGKNAQLMRPTDSDGSQIINVFMNGGSIDMSNLSAPEKSLIRLIYPESLSDPQEELKISLFPNPAGDWITCRVDSKMDALIQFDIYDARGQLIKSEKRSVFEGINDLAFSLSDMSEGVYVLKMNDHKKINSKTFIKY